MKDALLRALRTKQAEAEATPAPAPVEAAAPAAPTRKWSSRDFPAPAAPRNEAKVAARTSMHFKILSRTK
jgi:hypothetical protein